MDFFTIVHLPQMALELVLGLCIKLFCDNGRIHWRDFVNDFLFWVPGFRQLPGDGISRQVAAIPLPHHTFDEPFEPEALAAK